MATLRWNYKKQEMRLGAPRRLVLNESIVMPKLNIPSLLIPSNCRLSSAIPRESTRPSLEDLDRRLAAGLPRECCCIVPIQLGPRSGFWSPYLSLAEQRAARTGRSAFMSRSRWKR